MELLFLLKELFIELPNPINELPTATPANSDANPAPRMAAFAAVAIPPTAPAAEYPIIPLAVIGSPKRACSVT